METRPRVGVVAYTSSFSAIIPLVSADWSIARTFKTQCSYNKYSAVLTSIMMLVNSSHVITSTATSLIQKISLVVHYLREVWAAYLVGMANHCDHHLRISCQRSLHRLADSARKEATHLLCLLACPPLAWYIVYAAQWLPRTITPAPVGMGILDKPLATLILQ